MLFLEYPSRRFMWCSLYSRTWTRWNLPSFLAFGQADCCRGLFQTQTVDQLFHRTNNMPLFPRPLSCRDLQIILSDVFYVTKSQKNKNDLWFPPGNLTLSVDIPWRASKTILIAALRNFFRLKVLLFFSSKFFHMKEALYDVQWSNPGWLCCANQFCQPVLPIRIISWCKVKRMSEW